MARSIWAEARVGWIYLLIAGLLEIVLTTALRHTDGFTRLVPSAIFVIGLLLSLYLVEKSMQEIPLGTAYAIWAGIGVGGTVLVGALFYGEPLGALRLLFLTMLIGAIVGLKFVSD
jgi:quaternary ammonium compound-resistance protein SugE